LETHSTSTHTPPPCALSDAQVGMMLARGMLFTVEDVLEDVELLTLPADVKQKLTSALKVRRVSMASMVSMQKLTSTLQRFRRFRHLRSSHKYKY
jgi:hypothetical protein